MIEVFSCSPRWPNYEQCFSESSCFYEASTEEFVNYSKEIITNANLLCEHLKDKGIRVVSEKTENHLMLLDTRSVNLTGSEAEEKNLIQLES